MDARNTAGIKLILFSFFVGGAGVVSELSVSASPTKLTNMEGFYGGDDTHSNPPKLGLMCFDRDPQPDQE